jgi:menaquinone-dependent protoporphyrinogen oxidase
VSLSAGGPGAKPEAAQRYLETFLHKANWRPQHTATFAGALQYSRYGFFKKLTMRLIVGMAGGDTDPVRDYEYTDWGAVERFADDFTRHLKPS